METLKIRNYQDNDAPKLEQLLKDTGLYYESLDQKEIFKNKIEDNPGSIIVAEYDDKLVGTVFVIYDKWNPMIFHLGVHPDYRERGIATKLVDEAKERLKAKGVKKLSLFVDQENHKALEFYKNIGGKICNKNYALEIEL